MAGRVTTLLSARQRLLVWYDAHARDLPWRRTRDPYAIWVSEIMLQQTRVDTVIPYYSRFMTRFPSVHALAEAREDDVLAQFSGLGYYRRARLLYRGAQEVANNHQGQVPKDPSARRALPGIGRYTAGAIGSIAFDLPEPIVDGNVARVLSRYLGLDTPLGDKVTERALWTHAEALAQGERPGALNQALMELGATVCTPLAPQCAVCPIATACVALASGRTETLPVTPKKKPPKALQLVALCAQTEEQAHWLVRGEGNLFGGMWGCPTAEGKTRVQAAELARSLGLKGKLAPKSQGKVEHVLTHRRLQVEVFLLKAARGLAAEGLRAVTAAELDTLGIAKLTRKILALSAG